MPVATIISVSEFRSRFDISDDVSDARLTLHIGSASRRLRRWVGDAAYVQAADGVDPEAQSDLKNAEAHLAYHFALLGLHFTVSSKGIVATAQSDQGKEMRKYLSPAEISDLSTRMLDLAREIASPYCIDEGTVSSSWLVVDVEESI